LRSPEEALRKGFFTNLPLRRQPQLGYGRSPESWNLVFGNNEWPLVEMFIERVGRAYSYEWGGARHAVTFMGRPTCHGVLVSIQIWARYAPPTDRSVPASPIHRPGRVCWEHGSQCGLCLWLDEDTP